MFVVAEYWTAKSALFPSASDPITNSGIQRGEDTALHPSMSRTGTAFVELTSPVGLKMRRQTAFFDVPLHENFHQASKSGSSYDLRRILDNSLVAIRPGDAVTFVDNHE